MRRSPVPMDAQGMLAELGVMDWIALLVAASILAAAAATVAIALTLANDRYSALSRGRRVTKGRISVPAVRRATPPEGEVDPPAEIVDLRSAVSPDEARAIRADRLLRRPIPEGPRRSVLDAPPAPKYAVLAVNGQRELGFELRSPGFFEDPLGRHEQRYWDGERWTEYVKEEGRRFIDPF